MKKILAGATGALLFAGCVSAVPMAASSVTPIAVSATVLAAGRVSSRPPTRPVPPITRPDDRRNPVSV